MGEPSLTPQERSIDPACPQAGLWVVVCPDPAGGAMPRLASVGRGLFRGQSPRANLDQVARQHLLPLLVEALALFSHVVRDEQGVPQTMRGITMRADDFDVEDDPGFAEQEFLSGVLRLTSDTLCVVDLGHGRFYTPNHPWSRLGIDMPLEARVADAVHPEDLASFEALLQDVLAGDGTPTSTVVRFRAFGPQGWTR